MAVNYDTPYFPQRQRPLARTLDRISLLRRSTVNFIPIGHGRTIRTAPLLEDTTFSWRERYVEAAMIYLTNPLAFSAQSLLNDEIASPRIVVEEKCGTNEWKEHDQNELADWLPQPNPQMDIKEFFRAYCTHFHTFGGVYPFMFQKGDILPNGKINLEMNCFDLIFPGRLAEDVVSNPYGIDWYYLPIGFEEPFKLNNNSLFIDVIYNPIAHSLGVSLPNAPLEMIFQIHNLYMKNIRRFFTKDAIPTHLLTRVIDIQKDATASGIQDGDIEEALGRVYAQVGRGGVRENGWLGLRGDWRAIRMGSPLPELLNKDLLQYIDALISGVYKIPPSLFWAGLQSSNQRASRQQDSIDFYNMKIQPMLVRMTERLSKFLVPKFLPGKEGKFRVGFDVSEMPLAQYAVTKEYRMYERWWTQRIIKRGTFLNYVNDASASKLSEKERGEFYDGGKQGQLGAGTGEQSIESENGLE